MPHFVYIMKQRGEGCDYTIGCGTVADVIEADDYNDAFAQIARGRGWDEYADEAYTADDIEDIYRGEYSLERLTIFEVSSSVDGLYDDYFQALIRARKGLDEDKAKEERRRQYEELQKEFG